MLTECPHLTRQDKLARCVTANGAAYILLVRVKKDILVSCIDVANLRAEFCHRGKHPLPLTVWLVLLRTGTDLSAPLR